MGIPNPIARGTRVAAGLIAAVIVLAVQACGGQSSARPIDELREYSDITPETPILVFVYSDP